MLLIIFLAEGASIDIDSDEESPQQQGMREMIQTQRKLQSSDAEIDVHPGTIILRGINLGKSLHPVMLRLKSWLAVVYKSYH